MTNISASLITLGTSFLGWIIILFFHVHALRRDEVSRKKDRLQSELDSLLTWALDTNMLTKTPMELRETFLAGKITTVEIRHDELYEVYFKDNDENNCISELRDLDVYGLGDDDSVKEFQLEIVNIAMMISDSIENDYGKYCRESWVHKRIIRFFLHRKKYFFVLILFFFIGYLAGCVHYYDINSINRS